MADSVNEAELGRSKQSETPREHLLHLLTVGWDPEAPLIKKVRCRERTAFGPPGLVEK